MMASPDHAGERGFTMLETLIAIVIAASVVGALYYSAGGTLRNSARLDERSKAAMVASSALRLVQARRSLEPLGKWSDGAGRFDIHVQTSTVLTSRLTEPWDSDLELRQIDITVSRHGGRRSTPLVHMTLSWTGSQHGSINGEQ